MKIFQEMTSTAAYVLLKWCEMINVEVQLATTVFGFNQDVFLIL